MKHSKLKIRAINRSKGENRWCGPAVISSLTGCSTDDAAYQCRRVTQRRATGLTTAELFSVLKKFGVTYSKRVSLNFKTPTLAQFLRENKFASDEVVLILAGSHYQLVSGRRFVCGITKQIVDFKHKLVKRRARVESYFVLCALEGVKSIDDVGRKPTRKIDRTLIALRKRARAFDIKIEVDYQEYDFDAARVDKTFYISHKFHDNVESSYARGNDELRELLEEILPFYEKRAARAAREVDPDAPRFSSKVDGHSYAE